MRFFAAIFVQGKVNVFDLTEIHPSRTLGQARKLAERAFGAENVIEVFCDSSKDITKLLRDVFYSGARHHAQVFHFMVDREAKSL